MYLVKCPFLARPFWRSAKKTLAAVGDNIDLFPHTWLRRCLDLKIEKVWGDLVPAGAWKFIVDDCTVESQICVCEVVMCFVANLSVQSLNFDYTIQSPVCGVVHRTTRAFVIGRVILQGDWIWDDDASWARRRRAAPTTRVYFFACTYVALVYFPASSFSLLKDCLLQCAIVHTSIAG